ncbi:hypothetical protein [Streptomyces albidoflavus]|uniref:hypothetical protein n=1 Tax=Streptomyces albidoflavus TaxID=1886 RepID=UPI00188A0868|nr:hypothetical protein [Streptomyces albidoflavus]MBF4134853.1 hypothetical protein [Streptomyces albidoflavus]
MSVAYHHAGPCTVEEVLALPDDTTERTELVGGQLMMSPAPTMAHQRASHRLHAHGLLAVAEIASPHARLADRKPDPAPRVTIGRRRAEAYKEQPPVLAGGRVRFDEPFPVEFDPASLTIR